MDGKRNNLEILVNKIVEKINNSTLLRLILFFLKCCIVPKNEIRNTKNNE